MICQNLTNYRCFSGFYLTNMIEYFQPRSGCATPYLLSKRRNMVELKRIQEKIEPIVVAHDLQIVSIRWDKMGHQKLLEISLQNQNQTLDLQEASDITGPISEALDEMEELDFEYILDIGSPGVEKVLKTEAELIQHLEEYVQVNFVDHRRESIKGILQAVDSENVTIKYFIKGRPKKEILDLEAIEKIHLAVKF